MGSPQREAVRAFGKVTVHLVHDDIAARKADALVNAANTRLVMGGGVAAALRAKGGLEIHNQAIAHAPAPLGSVVRTWAGKLDARYVYHAVVIDYDVSKGTTETDVTAAVRSVLLCARQDGIRSVAMPLFGAGVGGLSVPASLRAILDTIEDEADAFGSGLLVEVAVRDEDEFAEAAEVFREFKDRGSRAREEAQVAEDYINELLRDR